MFSHFLKRTIAPKVGTILQLYLRLKANFSIRTQPTGLKQELSPHRPNDWVHIYYAVQAYHDSGGILLGKQGWNLIEKPYRSKENSYVGTAYRHKEKQHIIAHRGTQDRRDRLYNFKIITHHLSHQLLLAILRYDAKYYTNALEKEIKSIL